MSRSPLQSLSSIRVVLVEGARPRNIGAAARAIKTMGCEWSATEIAERWLKVYPAKNGVAKKERIAAIEADPEQIERFRSYLTNLSWVMKSIVEPIARKANAEDNVTGRSWEGRFKSQLLMSEKAALGAQGKRF
jgi:hypothetical protein